jgi:hypothetical protein
MAISVTFNGATIYKPGAYSKELIDLGGGFPLSPTGLVAILGESTSGTPGANVTDISQNVFTPDQMPAIQAMYGSGPLVDACNFLFAPGADGALPGGAQSVYIYKTNASTIADLNLAPYYTFTISSATVNAGAVYAGNGQEFTVLSGIVSGTSLQVSGTGAPASAPSTLLLLSGTGPATLSYSAVSGSPSYGQIDALQYGTTGNLIAYTAVAVPPAGAEAISSATFDTTNIAIQGRSLVLRIQGAATSLDNTFTVPNTVVSRATLQSALNAGGNWSNGLPSNMTFTVGGSTDSLATLTVLQGQSANSQRNGYGTNFDLVSGNLLAYVNIAAGLYISQSEDMSVITINNTNNTTVETITVGGNIVLNIGRNGGVAPQVTITLVNGVQTLHLINNAAQEYVIPLANFPTLGSLASYISASTAGNWSASVPSVLYSQFPPSSLDTVTGLGANGTATILPAQIKDDAYSVQQDFNASGNVSLAAIATGGLPDPQGPVFLAGGSLGGTSSASIVNAINAFSAIHINSIVPLFSRNASQDILDGITDPSSNYTIAAIHQGVKSFLSLQATTKQRLECQGYLSMHDTYANCIIEAQNMADARIQLVIQDIFQVNSLGQLQWFLPWAGACLLAGARGGAPVGLPMTHKYFNMSGIRQTAQLLSTPESQIVQSFNPATQYENAIQNGITFWEKPASGGFRLVVDNTTYGADANWVYNRGNVLYAADVLAYDFRNQLEDIFVGVKNTVSAAAVKSVCDSILTGYLAQGITVSTADAANGYKQLVVQIVGNTINVSVVVKLVEGIDFVLATITLQRASSQA